MRWFLPIIFAVLGGMIDDGRGTLVGIVAGMVLALMIGSSNRSQASSSPVRPPPLPPPLPPQPQQTRSSSRAGRDSVSVDRLHQIMRELDSSRSSAGQVRNQSKRTTEVDISASPRRIPKLNWYSPR